MYVKAYQVVHCKYVRFILSQLYFSKAIEKHNHPQGEMPLLRKAKTDLGSGVG